MKIPALPPSADILIANLIQQDKKRFFDLLYRYGSKPIDEKGRYLHWDQLRFRQPPDGMTTEEWWMTTKMARNAASGQLPFRDRSDHPFIYNEPPRLKFLLHFADSHAGGTLGSPRASLTADDGRRYLRQSLAEEPFASSLIEGAVTTREIARKMIFEGQAPRSRDERMVMNNFNGMEFVKETQNDPLTPLHILELHRIMTEGTLDTPDGAGRLRTNGERIAVVDDSTGEIIHMPPDAETLPQRLEALCAFANAPDEDTTYIHPLLKAIVLHFMLAYDHPFIDGNGRTARALFYRHALKAGYWLMEYTSISSVIARSHTDYYRAFLHTETDESDMTYFLLHQAEVIHAALQDIHAYADEKKTELEHFQDILDRNHKHPLNLRQIALVQDFSLKRQRLTTIADHMAVNNVSYLTARGDLEDLARRKIVRKTKRGRISTYLPTARFSQETQGQNP